MKAKKEFTEQEREIYRTGVLNGEAVTEARHRRIIIQNGKLRNINRILVNEFKNLQTYDEALRDICREHVKHLPIITKLAKANQPII